jgi:hypothetical protein
LLERRAHGLVERERIEHLDGEDVNLFVGRELDAQFATQPERRGEVRVVDVGEVHGFAQRFSVEAVPVSGSPSRVVAQQGIAQTQDERSKWLSRDPAPCER